MHKGWPCRPARCALQLPKRLARRLMDLQLLPHIVVMNPHIRMVYKNLHDSFQTLRALPPVRTLEENRRLVVLLQQQLDQHGGCAARRAAAHCSHCRAVSTLCSALASCGPALPPLAPQPPCSMSWRKAYGSARASSWLGRPCSSIAFSTACW